MGNMILTQILAQSTSDFHINMNSMQLKSSIIMSNVKFINEIIQNNIFQLVRFSWK